MKVARGPPEGLAPIVGGVTSPDVRVVPDGTDVGSRPGFVARARREGFGEFVARKTVGCGRIVRERDIVAD